MEQTLRFVLTHRRLIAAVLLGLSVAFAISAVTKTPETQAVQVASRDLPSGKPVKSTDFKQLELPVEAVPAETLSRSELPGRVLTGAMRAGEVFTDRRVVIPRGMGPDQVFVSVEVAAATGLMFRPGDRLNLVAVGEDGTAETVAERVELVNINAAEDRDSAVLGLAAPNPIATRIAQVGVSHRLTAIVSPPK